MQIVSPEFDYHSNPPYAHTTLKTESFSVSFMFEDALQRALFWRRVASEASAMLEAAETGTLEGYCDCGETYDVGSRFDHDAETGQCWDCSDRDLNAMTATELDAYLNG